MAGFETYEPSALRIPLRGEFGQQLAAAAGKMRDEEIALCRWALLSRLPSRCPDDALDAVGRMLKIERYPGETNASYRGRLVAAWPTWETAGSDEGIEEQIKAFGIPDARVYADFEGQFGPGPQGSWYTRFWVVLGPDFSSTGIGPMLLGSWTLGTGTLGSTAAKAQIRALKRLILKWKSSHGLPVRIILLFGDGPVLGVGFGSTKPLKLGQFTLGGASKISWPMARTLGDTLPTLGSPGFVLGGFEL